MSVVYIYALLDPDTKEAHYIGATEDPERRLREHMFPTLAKSKERARWIMGLISQEKEPLMVVLEESSEESWQECEEEWIQKYREMGAPLKNVRSGGEGGASESVKYRAKFIRERRNGTMPAPPAFFEVHLQKLVLKKQAKERAFISQMDIYEQTGVPIQVIRAWYKGSVDRLDARALVAFMKYFNCRMSDLVSQPSLYEIEVQS